MYVILIKADLPSLDPTVDDSTNGFVFKSDTATAPPGTNALFNHVVGFYNTVNTGQTVALCSYISQVIDRTIGHMNLTAYNITSHLDGTPHGAPVAAFSSGLLGAASGSTPLPEGCAATLSWRADYGSDVEFGPGTRPRARDRNRLYLGPLNSSAITADSATHRCELTPQFITDALHAMFFLSTSVTIGADDWVWQVWSRKNADTKLPTEGWLDNRVDYQRRRSDPSPATRTFLPLSSV